MTPTIPTITSLVRSDDIGQHLDTTVDRLTQRGGAPVSEKALDEVVQECWPTPEGWTVQSIEDRWFEVLHILHHPTHGTAATLISTQPRTARIGDVDKPINERWDTLDIGRRFEHVLNAVHVQGVNALDILSHFTDPGDLRRAQRRRLMVMFASLVESVSFMDDTTRTMVALNPSFEPLLTVARNHWHRQSLDLGKQPSTFLLG